ncbi:uroporphyrinogen-III C-methyltransferase [Microbulbifer thermotolerans]|uniref:uroporphyrinogen-III C-methyltransferase n=1 Tax=Microbulbifer thermotolerans TaxID=252514 RepID=UPI00224AF40C|nr:uroporphyrinogen-III C-methyltransferase [Microbulbifer thermotolerans]MCX2780282.1 uroporphyrinogen-III C-methyltransferase [Microbulbifer thermotolerans]MCX2805299.1 uroporphyrinogen-III C-methyltransferase [Microbulbifer thermotolerans]
MTDETSKDTAQASTPPEGEKKSNFAKAAQEKSTQTGDRKGKRRTKGGKGWLWLFVFAAIGGLGAWGWLSWPQLRSHVSSYLRLTPLTQDSASPTESVQAPQPAGQPRQPATPQPPSGAQAPEAPAPSRDADTAAQEQRQAESALRNQVQQQSRTIALLQQQLAALQREMTSQANRLSELGNVNRSDWQLAEADYLLRLANQRLLLERDSRAALGLLEEVDKILRRLDQPDLYGVRQQLANDITALKLVENIDREGLYAQLRALEDQLIRVNIQPEFDITTQGTVDTQVESDADSSPLQRGWDSFTQFLHESVRIRDGNIDPVLLSPQSEARFRQSLRLNMEQAELALLREDTNVYRDSLNRNRQLLLEYAVPGKRRDALMEELRQLSQVTIKADLPSLAASQRALHDYIERLHKTTSQSTDVPGGDSQ